MSKMQPATGLGTVNREDLGRKLSCFRCEKKWRTFRSLADVTLRVVFLLFLPCF